MAMKFLNRPEHRSLREVAQAAQTNLRTFYRRRHAKGSPRKGGRFLYRERAMRRWPRRRGAGSVSGAVRKGFRRAGCGCDTATTATAVPAAGALIKPSPIRASPLARTPATRCAGAGSKRDSERRAHPGRGVRPHRAAIAMPVIAHGRASIGWDPASRYGRSYRRTSAPRQTRPPQRRLPGSASSPPSPDRSSLRYGPPAHAATGRRSTPIARGRHLRRTPAPMRCSARTALPPLPRQPGAAHRPDKVGTPKLIIGAMMRKLAQVAFGVIKSGKPFDPMLHGA